MEPQTSTTQHRVRTLIPFLNYAELTKNKVIPKEKLFTGKIVEGLGGKTISPVLSKNLGRVSYGIFVESVIETLLLNDCNIKSINPLRTTLPKDMQCYYNPSDFSDVASMLL